MKKTVLICLIIASAVIAGGCSSTERASNVKETKTNESVAVDGEHKNEEKADNTDSSEPENASSEDDLEEAYAIFKESEAGNKDDENQKSENEIEAIKKPFVDENGQMNWSKIQLGKYRQNYDSEQPVEWLVLDIRDNNTAFVVSYYILDCKEIYDDDEEVIPWKDNPLRKWMNTKMYNKLFDDNEKKAVKKSKIVTDGVKTEDRLFLLSGTEVDIAEYGFSSNYRRSAQNTVYAEEQGNFTSDGSFTDGKGKGRGLWWLRSVVYYDDEDMYSQEYVKPDGRLWDGYINLEQGIRPAMYVDLNSDAVTYSGTFKLAESE